MILPSLSVLSTLIRVYDIIIIKVNVRMSLDIKLDCNNVFRRDTSYAVINVNIILHVQTQMKIRFIRSKKYLSPFHNTNQLLQNIPKKGITRRMDELFLRDKTTKTEVQSRNADKNFGK